MGVVCFEGTTRGNSAISVRVPCLKHVETCDGQLHVQRRAMPASLAGYMFETKAELENHESFELVHRPQPYPLKLQALGKLIFYRHIAQVTQKVEKLCF